MNFQNRSLSLIAYANGTTIWHYADRKCKLAEMDLDHFFDPIYALCAVGDKIMVSLNDAYTEVVIVKIHDGNVICKPLTTLEYPKDEPEEEAE